MRAFYYQHDQTDLSVWREALDQLLDPAVQITATSLSPLKSFAIEKFKDRALWAEKDMDRIRFPQASLTQPSVSFGRFEFVQSP